MTTETFSSNGRTVAVLVGAGRMGEIHARNAAATASIELRYVVDQVRPNAERLAAAVDAELSTLDTALADPDVTAMIVATATEAHDVLVRTGIDRGLALLCEKPLTGQVGTSARLAQKAAETDSTLMVGFHKRFDSAITELRRVLRSGQIGELVSLSLISRDPSPPAEAYEIGGGAYFDMMIHDFDLLGWLVDDQPTSVLATQSREVARCAVDLESGASAYLECGRRSVSSYDQTIEVIGTVGAVRILDDEHVVSTTFRETTDRRWHSTSERTVEAVKPFFLPRYSAAFSAEMAAFGEMALGGRHAGATAEDALQAAHLAAAATESAITSTRVHLRPTRPQRLLSI